MNIGFISFLISLALLLSGCQEINVTMANNSANAPTVLSSWITQLGSATKAFPGANHSLNDYCRSTAVDSSGNVYCGGRTSGAIGEANGGGNDAFVMKLNSSGVILWVRQLGSVTEASSLLVNDTSGSEYCDGVAVDNSGFVYCAGRTTGALSETNGGNEDAFVMKLSSEGEIVWLTQLGDVTEAVSIHVNDTAGSDACASISVDNAGNVYCGGSTTGALSETNGGSFDAFVMKLNSSGVIQWIRQIGDTTEVASTEVNDTSGVESCYGVDFDILGNVYCAGNTNGALGEAAGGGGNMDAFVMKLDSTGALTWLRHIGNTTELASPLVISTTQNDSFNGLAVDSNGDIICAGFSSSSFAENNGGGNDALFAKYDTNGDIIWLSQIGSDTELASPAVIDTNQYDACSSLTVDANDNIYCSGETGSELGETAGSWMWDPMVMKLNSTGTVQWVNQLGAVKFPSPDYFGGGAWGVAVDASGSVYISGEIYGDTDEEEGGGTNGDAFIAKIKSDGTMDL